MRKRNPYRVQFDIVNRFRGLWQKASRFNINKSYTPVSENLVSTKIGQLDSREGHEFKISYDDGIIQAGRFNTVRYIGEGTNIFAESVVPSVIRGVPDYTPPSTWLPPPGTTTPEAPLNNCEDWWENLGTPEEDKNLGGTFPDCFTTQITCAEYWNRVNTPLEHRKTGGAFPDCISLPPLPPPPTATCADAWANSPSLISYENAENADHVIVDGDMDLCWTMTCADVWATQPEYAEYEVVENADLELVETGGTATMADCWDTTLNCEALYKQNPQWDEYRKEGAVYPDCWDFTEEPPTPTCADYWGLAGTPETQKKRGGVYPDCFTVVPEVEKPAPQCYPALYDFPDGGEELTWYLLVGQYSTSSTTKPLDFIVDVNAENSVIPRSLSANIVGRGATSTQLARNTFVIKDGTWFYDYIAKDYPCRKEIDYHFNFQVGGWAEVGTYSALLQCYLSYNSTVKNIPYVAKLTAYVIEPPWKSSYDAFNQRREMNGESSLPPFESYDLSSPEGQRNFIHDMQVWCESIRDYNTKLAISGEQSVIEAREETLVDAFFRDWDKNIKADADLPNSWRRLNNGVWSYGRMQLGDTLGIHLFEDLDKVFRVLESKGHRTPSVWTTRTWVDDNPTYSYNNSKGDTYLYNNKAIDAYATFTNPEYNAKLKPEAIDLYIHTTNGNWNGVQLFIKNFSINETPNPDGKYFRLANFGDTTGASREITVDAYPLFPSEALYSPTIDAAWFARYREEDLYQILPTQE